MKVYNCYFDGACEPRNPDGNMGVGVYITEGQNVFEWSDFHKEKIGNTNNIAEYLAVIKILELLKNKKSETIQIYGDSKLVIEQLSGRWKIKVGQYVPYAQKARELLLEIKKNNTVGLHWIPREQNQKADDLSKAHLMKINQ